MAYILECRIPHLSTLNEQSQAANTNAPYYMYERRDCFLTVGIPNVLFIAFMNLKILPSAFDLHIYLLSRNFAISLKYMFFKKLSWIRVGEGDRG